MIQEGILKGTKMAQEILLNETLDEFPLLSTHEVCLSSAYEITTFPLG